MDAPRPPAPRFADDPDRLLSYAELAEWANAPERTVRQWVYRGDGPPALRIGRYRRFRVCDCLTWLETRYVQGGAAVNDADRAAIAAHVESMHIEQWPPPTSAQLDLVARALTQTTTAVAVDAA